MLPVILLILAVVWLAYSNGANDNIKGVATLVGTGTMSYRQALGLTTLATFCGSMLALALGAGLITTFSGKGLVMAEALVQTEFLLAVAIGAAATVFLATLLGLPISTTHSLVGALVGAGLVVPPGLVSLAALANSFLLPLLLAPLLATVLTVAVYRLFRWIRLRMGIERETCLCVGEEVVEVVGVELGPLSPQAALSMVANPSRRLSFTSDAPERCMERYAGRLWGFRAQSVLDRCHQLSGAAVCFARGVNDTPKIVALLLAAGALGVQSGLLLVGVAIAIGGLVQAGRVAHTMSHEITRMRHGQGFSANLVTAFLVIVASRFGLPVSTTHVSCGSIFGVGIVSGEGRWKMIGGILGAWVITLPVAGGLAALSAALL